MSARAPTPTDAIPFQVWRDNLPRMERAAWVRFRVSGSVEAAVEFAHDLALLLRGTLPGYRLHSVKCARRPGGGRRVAVSLMLWKSEPGEHDLDVIRQRVAESIRDLDPKDL